MASSTIAIVIAVVAIVLFMVNKIPMSIVALASSALMAILIPEMKLGAAYEGFAATGWMMVVGMLVVSDSLFETGVAQKIGDRIAHSWWAQSERRFIVAVAAICTLMSAFMSNNGTVAIWMPIIAIVAAGSGGKIRSKIVIFVAGTAAVIGGACTLMGSTSQLAANAVLQGYAGFEDGFGIFDQAKIMLPTALVQITFWGTFGYSLLKKVLKPESPDFDKDNMYAPQNMKLSTERTPDAPLWKRRVSLGTMLLCIVLFVLQGFAPFNDYFNIGIIGMIGAVIVLVTGCIPLKKAYSELPWDVLITIGAISGLGTGLQVSGGGALIANAVLGFFGGQNASVVVLTIVIVALTSVMTNFMANNATAAMLSPICIEMALALGISPIPWVVVIAACSNLAIATNYGTAVNMQILPAGYKFSDFMKIGGPLLLILIPIVIITTLLVLF
ncbi:SLC13 family permease [Olsenella profusa]|uniref:Citrate transporter n=1 Tax=Olsenella profusa F0195 TaxID=1125712 RepID=U2T1A3_9ACTN|nr:SLC13 family permease [Olsenella profusa]ERL06829.1 citrate transporter [Olsenella profusa F0195]